MNLKVFIVLFILDVCSLSVKCLQCYSCVSTDPGCGQELNLRLQRQITCPSPGRGGGENLCVKSVRRVGSSETIFRDCLTQLKRDPAHRAELPVVERHGYCAYARNDDPNTPYDKNHLYCYCNDWNGCNGSPNFYHRIPTFLIYSLALISLLKHFLHFI